MLIVNRQNDPNSKERYFVIKMHYWRVPETLNYRKSGRNILSNVKPLGVWDIKLSPKRFLVNC